MGVVSCPSSDPQQGEKVQQAVDGAGTSPQGSFSPQRRCSSPRPILVASSGRALPGPCLCCAGDPRAGRSAAGVSQESGAEGEHPLPRPAGHAAGDAAHMSVYVLLAGNAVIFGRWWCEPRGTPLPLLQKAIGMALLYCTSPLPALRYCV